MLRCTEIHKTFGGVKALNGVSLEVAAGQVVGLIGPNGSGKSTLVNVLTGFIAPDEGRVELDGEDLTGRSPSAIRRRGVARTFQNLRLYDRLSVLDNVLIGLHLTFSEPGRTAGRWLGAMVGTPGARRREREARETAMACLDAVDLAGKAHLRVDGLSYGDQKRLELARATAVPPAALLLDEPTAGMAPDEAAELMALFRSAIDADPSRCLVLIEHRLELVLQMCDRVAVLESGVKIADGLPQEIAEDEDVMDVYVGRRR